MSFTFNKVTILLLAVVLASLSGCKTQQQNQGVLTGQALLDYQNTRNNNRGFVSPPTMPNGQVETFGYNDFALDTAQWVACDRICRLNPENCSNACQRQYHLFNSHAMGSNYHQFQPTTYYNSGAGNQGYGFNYANFANNNQTYLNQFNQRYAGNIKTFMPVQDYCLNRNNQFSQNVIFNGCQNVSAQNMILHAFANRGLSAHGLGNVGAAISSFNSGLNYFSNYKGLRDNTSTAGGGIQMPSGQGVDWTNRNLKLENEVMQASLKQTLGQFKALPKNLFLQGVNSLGEVALNTVAGLGQQFINQLDRPRMQSQFAYQQIAGQSQSFAGLNNQDYQNLLSGIGALTNRRLLGQPECDPSLGTGYVVVAEPLEDENGYYYDCKKSS